MSAIKICNKIFWCKKKGVINFGDYLGPYLYKKITGINPVYTKSTNNTNDPVYLTVGSILQQNFCKENAIVWGSGIITKSAKFSRPLSIKSVRGPFTHLRCTKLGYNCPKIYGDPALLLPKFYNSNITKKFKIGLVPHNNDYNDVIKIYGLDANIQIINLNMNSPYDIETIIDKINECEYIISSSLHGIIVSHAYNIKCRWAKFEKQIYGDDIKFLDYYYSQGLINKIYTKKIDLSNKHLTLEELINLVKDMDVPTNKINLDLLLDVCPFNTNIKSK